MCKEKDSQQRNENSNDELYNTIQKSKDSIDKNKIAELWKKKHYKKLSITILLSWIVGLFLLGLGYYYLERKFKGLVFLAAGISLIIIGVLSIILFNIFESFYIFYMIFLFLWTYQLRETITMFKNWNLHISKGAAPW